MPLYEFECAACGEITEKVFTIQECLDMCLCDNCGHVAVKVISKPATIKPQWDEYFDENVSPNGTIIRGRRHRKELMKQQGLEDKPLDHTAKRIEIERREHNKREQTKERGK